MSAWDRYWFDFSVLRRRMVLWRVLFFGLLSADFWLILLDHAPRFGAGGFNVSQLPFLDPYLPLPTPAVVGPLYILGGFLSLCIAAGVAVRRCLFVLAPLYAGVYLWSQSDSYQHHYLIALLLVLLTFVPGEAWTLPRSGEPAAVKSWAMRLVYTQIGLMYVWTAVTKTTPTWLDGATLHEMVTCEPAERLRAVAGVFRLSLDAGLRVAAVAVMLGEYVGGVVYLVRPLWGLGLCLLPLFHVAVETLGLDIELFSYYMIATHVALLLPDRFIERGGRALGPIWGRALPRARPVPPATAVAATAAAAGLCMVAGVWLPYAGAPLTAVLLGAAAVLVLNPLEAAGGRFPGRVAAVSIAAATLVGVTSLSETPYNYYRQWGGFLRRMGDLAAAEEKYALADDAAHGRPARHLQLARMRAKTGDVTEATSLLDEAIRRQVAAIEALPNPPKDAHGWLAFGLAQRELADAAAFAQELYPQADRAADVAAVRQQHDAAIRAARLAFQQNIELDPACGQGRVETTRLIGGRLLDSESAP